MQGRGPLWDLMLYVWESQGWGPMGGGGVILADTGSSQISGHRDCLAEMRQKIPSSADPFFLTPFVLTSKRNFVPFSTSPQCSQCTWAAQTAPCGHKRLNLWLQFRLGRLPWAVILVFPGSLCLCGGFWMSLSSTGAWNLQAPSGISLTQSQPRISDFSRQKPASVADCVRLRTQRGNVCVHQWSEKYSYLRFMFTLGFSVVSL